MFCFVGFCCPGVNIQSGEEVAIKLVYSDPSLLVTFIFLQQQRSKYFYMYIFGGFRLFF